MKKLFVCVFMFISMHVSYGQDFRHRQHRSSSIYCPRNEPVIYRNYPRRGYPVYRDNSFSRIIRIIVNTIEYAVDQVWIYDGRYQNGGYWQDIQRRPVFYGNRQPVFRRGYSGLVAN